MMPALLSARSRVAAIRVGDVERERAVAALHDHFAAGRLDPDELEERLTAALTARTRADLDGLFTDLPAPAERLHMRPWRPWRVRRPASPTLILVAVLVVGLCAALVLAAAFVVFPWVLLVAVGWYLLGRGLGACHRRRF